jgi:hypothetical protein
MLSPKRQQHSREEDFVFDKEQLKEEAGWNILACTRFADTYYQQQNATQKLLTETSTLASMRPKRLLQESVWHV